MASWKDHLRPASFRGKKFFVDSSQYTGGRRVSFHEFPDRDDPYPEDLGKVGRTFKVEGYIIGDDYFTLKKELVEATEKEGPGELVHPYYGTLQVQLGPFSIDETKQDGRFAKLSFLFYEAGNNRFPQQIDDKVSLLEDTSANALLKAKDSFDKKFSILDQPGFVVEAARDKVAQVTDAFMNATKNVRVAADKIADLAFSIRNLKAEVNDLLQSPAKLSQRLLDSLALLEGAIETDEGKLQAHSSLFAFGASDPSIIGLTPQRDQQRTNKVAIDSLIKQASVAKAVNVGALVVYPSTDDATKVRNQLAEVIEEISLSTPDDEVYKVFRDLNAQMVNAIPDSDSELPNIQTVTLQNSSNSLLVAYDLFEKPEVELDLVARNKIKHPGFIVGGTTLEVIDVRKNA